MRKALALAVLSLACACGAGRSKPRASVVRIGELLDRTGTIATPSWTESIRLAVATMNEALARSGHASWKFEIAAANSRNVPDAARAAALDLVRRERVKALITDSGQDDVAVNRLFYDGVPDDDLGVPVVCIACTSHRIDAPDAAAEDPVEQAALRNAKGWNFRTAASDEAEARALAPLLVARGHGKRLKVGIYASRDPDGRALSDALKLAVVERSPHASVEQIFHDPAVDAVAYGWASDVARLLDERNESTGAIDGPPDVVVAATFPRLLVGFLEAWVDSGTAVPIVHSDAFRSTRVALALNVSIDGHEGVSQAAVLEGPSAQAFARDLEARTAQPPALRDAAAYDAAMTLMLAALRAAHAGRLDDLAQVSGTGIRDSLRGINDKTGEPVYAGVGGIATAIRLIDAGKRIDYAGASGPCDYDERGDVAAPLSRYRVQGGRFVELEKLSCARGGDCAPAALVSAR